MLHETTFINNFIYVRTYVLLSLGTYIIILLRVYYFLFSTVSLEREIDLDGNGSLQ
jgi:hypothetical protein